MRASQLRPPGSRLPAPNVRPPTLNEMSDSQNNVRSQPSMLPQSGIKRPQSNSGTPSKRALTVLLIADQTTVSQALPDPKARKTLMERAGEFPSKPSVTATPAPRTANKGVSLASQTGVSSAACLDLKQRVSLSACLARIMIAYTWGLSHAQLLPLQVIFRQTITVPRQDEVASVPQAAASCYNLVVAPRTARRHASNR